MDTQNLRIFVEVIRRGSYAAAAREMSLDPSTVSRAISGLEAELGLRLLQRTTRQVRPTEAGLAYFQRIESLTEELEHARQHALDLSQRPSGLLRLTTTRTFGVTALASLLPEFLARYPELEVHIDLSDAVVDLVAGGYDLAIRVGQLADSKLVATRLVDLQYRVVASRRYLEQHGTPENFAALASHQCLNLPLPGLSSDWLFRSRDGQIERVPIPSRVQINDALALKQCALNDMGITVCSLWTVREELQSGELKTLFKDYEVTLDDFGAATWLVYPTRDYLPLKVRVFIDYLKEKFQTKGSV